MQRAGGDDAHDLAIDGALAGGGVTNLFADRDRFATRDQARQITFGAMVRYARHRDGFAPRLATLGEGNVQQCRGAFGVIKK